jgi:hypothetical protein
MIFSHCFQTATLVGSVDHRLPEIQLKEISFCSLAALSIKQFKIIKIHNRIFNYGINRKGTEMIAQING